MKKFLMIFAAALVFAACEETSEVVLPEPVLGEVSASVKDNNVSITCPISDFTYVNKNVTPVGVWYSVKGADDQKVELPAEFVEESSTIVGSFENVEYGAYNVGALVFVNGNKYYSKGVGLNNALNPVFGKAEMKAADKVLTISGTVSDFKVIGEKTTVGVWFSSTKDGEKKEAAGQFDAATSTVSGTIEVSDYAHYFVGTYVDVNGVKLYSEAVEVEVVLPQLTYGGVTYNTVLLPNGQIWMAENLRYVPEGMKVSDDPAKGDIWYSYDLDNGVGKAVKSEEHAKKYGYLYDLYVALNLDKAKVKAFVEAGDDAGLSAYLKTVEGKQGICPEGWHIPTELDLQAICGKSLGHSSKPIEDAPFWNPEYKQGSIVKANELGFNFVPAGQMSKNGFSSVAAYSKVVLTDSNCGIPSFIGRPTPTTILSSTFYKNSISKTTKAITNSQFFGMMASFTTKYKDGGLSVLFANIESGYSVRCVRNAK